MMKNIKVKAKQRLLAAEDEDQQLHGFLQYVPKMFDMGVGASVIRNEHTGASTAKNTAWECSFEVHNTKMKDFVASVLVWAPTAGHGSGYHSSVDLEFKVGSIHVSTSVGPATTQAKTPAESIKIAVDKAKQFLRNDLEQDKVVSQLFALKNWAAL